MTSVLRFLAAFLCGVLLLGCDHPESVERPKASEQQVVTSALGAEAKAALESADEIEVLALDPTMRSEGGDAGPKWADGFKVVKKVTVSSKEDQMALRKALYQALQIDAPAAACYDPHHAMRIWKGQRLL